MTKVFQVITSTPGGFRSRAAAGERVRPRNDSGAAAVEFALVLPVMLTILFAITTFGIAFNNYIQLSSGVRAAARYLANARGSTTPVTGATSAFNGAAPMLTTGVTFVWEINGTACTTDTTCEALMGTSSAGEAAYVSATYPTCNLTVMGVNYAPGCQLNFTSQEVIE